MKLSLKIVLSLLLISVAGCSGNKPSKEKKSPSEIAETRTEEPPKPSVSKPTETINLTSLAGLPDYISGCSCYFSETEADFKNQKYVFAHDYDGLTVISLDNKPVKLKLLKTTRDSTTMSNQAYEETYANETYTATISVKYKKHSGYETWWNEGILTVTKKGAASISKKFEGECGC